MQIGGALCPIARSTGEEQSAESWAETGGVAKRGRVHVQPKEEGRGEAFRTGNRSLNLLQVAARSPRWTTESAGERVGVNSSLRLVDLPALKSTLTLRFSAPELTSIM